MIFASAIRGDLVFITALPADSTELETNVRQAYSDILDYLTGNTCTILSERIYGRISAAEQIQSIRKQIAGSAPEQFRLHPTFIEGIPFNQDQFAGIQIIAANHTQKKPLKDLHKNGITVGRKFHGSEAEYVLLSDVASVLPNEIHADRPAEAYETLRAADEILHEENWSISDVRRTWFYLDDILEWYNEFNVSRSRYFHESGLMNGSIKSVIPASTGIWGRNVHGFGTTMDVLAMRPSGENTFNVSRMINPRQNEATDYGSAFSRGVSVETSANIYGFVSGTASIDEQGKSIHPDDMEKQTARTFENIEALLEGVNGGLQNIVQATAFVKREQDIPVFEREVQKRNLENLPIIRTVADVCREDLLFELDATAIIAK